MPSIQRLFVKKWSFPFNGCKYSRQQLTRIHSLKTMNIQCINFEFSLSALQSFEPASASENSMLKSWSSPLFFFYVNLWKGRIIDSWYISGTKLRQVYVKNVFSVLLNFFFYFAPAIVFFSRKIRIDNNNEAVIRFRCIE